MQDSKIQSPTSARRHHYRKMVERWAKTQPPSPEVPRRYAREERRTAKATMDNGDLTTAQLLFLRAAELDGEADAMEAKR